IVLGELDVQNQKEHHMLSLPLQIPVKPKIWYLFYKKLIRLLAHNCSRWPTVAVVVAAGGTGTDSAEVDEVVAALLNAEAILARVAKGGAVVTNDLTTIK
ncbi:hypothetical protein NL321_27090, partial [Klebsiella pneumoniae]|nr:hypothetical protein [Klebsiella pneumoniae]